MSLFSIWCYFSVTIPTVPCCSCPKKASINPPNFTRIHVGFLLHSISSVFECKYWRELDKFCNAVVLFPSLNFVISVTKTPFRWMFELWANQAITSHHVIVTCVRFVFRHFWIIFQVCSCSLDAKNSSKVGEVSPYAYSTSLPDMPDWSYIIHMNFNRYVHWRREYF